MEYPSRLECGVQRASEKPQDVYREVMRNELEQIASLVVQLRLRNDELSTMMKGPRIDDCCNELCETACCGNGSYTRTMDRIISEMQQIRKSLAGEVDTLSLNLSSL